MVDELRVVQFLHPGGEHRPDKSGEKPWNQSIHRRTFVAQPGRYARAAGSRKAVDAELQFWCEWECQATLLRRFKDATEGRPRYLFEPYLQMPAAFDNHANTDPCVFGDCFRYCVCQQPSKPSLKRLARGSLILFGSYLAGRFVLDTVFVVAAKQSYGRRNVRNLGVPEAYRNIGLDPILAGSYCGQSDEFQLYTGATWDEPVHGMFSYFPCETGGEGFARPHIQLAPYVNPAHKRGIKSSVITAAEARRLWDDVARQVTDQNLRLGISAQMPDSSSRRATDKT